MHGFVICYTVWCKEAENERSDKKFETVAESNDQYIFLYDLTKISRP